MGSFPNKRAQFKKGKSGNPKGKPSGTPNIKTLISKVWSEEVIDDGGNKTIRGLLAVKAMFDKASKGNVYAFKALCERLEGMPKQQIEQTAIGYTVMPSVKIDGKETKLDIGEDASK